MDAKRQKCFVRLRSTSPSIQIIIQDDTRNIIQRYSLSKCFLPAQDNLDGTKEYQDRFTLMVDPGYSIAIVKACIQEKKRIAFKKQRLLSKDGKDLSDVQTLFALGIKNGSTLILRYASITQISMKMLMLFSMVKDPWSMSRTMQIIIHDDTYKDAIGSNDIIDGITKDCRISYTLMVAPDDIIIAVKAYIQEQTGFSFKNQKLLYEGAVLRNPQTLVSLGIKKESTLVLRYEPISSNKIKSSIFTIKVQRNDTIGDLKAFFQEKTGIRFHTLRPTYRGQILDNDKRLVDLDN
uniref:Ubiquitin-like domain-containing protein n=2 Tax=Solanum lycopersicum TaxID=4081 RepID=K4DAQ9_SOLLC